MFSFEVLISHFNASSNASCLFFAALSLPFHSSRIAYSSNNHIRYKIRGDRGEAKYENFYDATIFEKFISYFINNGSKCGET
jgi:hypothetical protein